MFDNNVIDWTWDKHGRLSRRRWLRDESDTESEEEVDSESEKASQARDSNAGLAATFYIVYRLSHF